MTHSYQKANGSMKKLLGFLVVMTLGMGCGGSTRPTKTAAVEKPAVRAPSAEIAHMGKSTVALVTTDGEGETYSFCTGVWVSPNEILTANHCVVAARKRQLAIAVETVEEMEALEEMEVDAVDTPIHYTVDAESVLGEEPSATHLGVVKKTDKKNDLALIQVATQGVPVHDVAELASQMPALGETVTCVGHPRGLYWTYVGGLVSSYRKDMPDGDGGKRFGPFLQVSAPVYFGNSGGGVFDSEGKLLGIASFIASSPNTAFYIHRDNIKKFLK